MIVACDSCLRRAWLIARLAPRIAGVLQRPDRRTSQLLALPDRSLVEAVAGPAGPTVAQMVGDFEPAAARQAIDAAETSAVCRHDAAYPPGLHDLVDRPAVVFFRGQEQCLHKLAAEPAVTLVGTRRPSAYGTEVAQALGRGLGAAGVTVVSGLALGIDASAHRGCIAGRGFPVAVLAGGPDIPYPRSHSRLYGQIVDRGLVLSEMPPGGRAFRWSFPARNRLMAALGGMTVVVEAAKPSGSLITVEFAQDLGRMVGAVPGRVTSSVARGSNEILREGASPVRGPEDVLDDLLGAGAGEAARLKAQRETLAALPPRQMRVLEAVERGDDVSDISRAAGIDAREARVALARLEAEGLVVRGALGSYERSAGA